MAQANIAPFELISYRGLLKSAEDIKNGTLKIYYLDLVLKNRTMT